MKYYLSFFIYLILILPGCKAQHGHEESFEDFIKQIESQIDNTTFNNGMFTDTVNFFFKKNSNRSSILDDKMKNWSIIQKKIRGTDYVIKLTSISSDKNIGEYELKNHHFLYKLKVTNSGKITEVTEVALKEVPGRPPSTGY